MGSHRRRRPWRVRAIAFVSARLTRRRALALVFIAVALVGLRPFINLDVKVYPLSERFLKEIPCNATGFKSLGSIPTRSENAKLRAATVGLFRTPSNACEAEKLQRWFSDLHSVWPWLKSYDHLVYHESDYVACKTDLENNARVNPAGNIKCVDLSSLGDDVFQFPLERFRNVYRFPTGTRDIGYMHMCRFFSVQLFRELWDDYDYIIRIDDDNTPINPNQADLFEELHAKGGVYGYPAEMEEWHKETARTFGLWLSDHMRDPDEIYLPHLNAFNEAMIYDLPSKVFFTNFFVTRLGFWRQSHVQHFLQSIDDSGNIYKHRWGDAPIHYVTLSLFADSCSVLPLCNVAYKHGSTGHVISGCRLVRHERHKWNDKLNPECHDGGGRGAVKQTSKKRKTVDWFKDCNQKRCMHPSTHGSFVGRGKGTFKLDSEECYYDQFSKGEIKDGSLGKWMLFVGGINAHSSFITFLNQVAPGIADQRDLGVQYGRAYDIVVDSNGIVVHRGKTDLDFDSGVMSRFASPFPRPYGDKAGLVMDIANPLPEFTDSQYKHYMRFFSDVAYSDERLRISLVICHSWSNAVSVLWLSGHMHSWGANVVLYAQVPSFEHVAACLEDVDYCRGELKEHLKPARRDVLMNRAMQQFRNFLSVSRILCRPNKATCFVLSGMIAEKKHNEAFFSVTAELPMDGATVHVLDMRAFTQSVPEEVSQGYLISQFLSTWLLQLIFNTVRPNAKISSGCPKEFDLSAACRKMPAVYNDPVLCEPLGFWEQKEGVPWIHLVRHPYASLNWRCRSVQPSC